MCHIFQVSLPHYKYGSFLEAVVLRYKLHLYLKQRNPDIFLVPCYDYDLIWHSHQLHPHMYNTDTIAILGKLLNHDDSVNDRAPNAKLAKSEKITRELWKSVFGVEFSKCGAMFRGEPPHGKLAQISDEDVFKASSIKAKVTITNMSIRPEHFEKFSLKVCSYDGRKMLKGPKLLKVKGPQTVWSNQENGISKFTFDTGKYPFLHFHLYTKTGRMCCKAKESIGTLTDPFHQVVENAPSTGQITMQITIPVLHGDERETGVAITISAGIEPPQKGACILSLQPDIFQPYTMLGCVEQLWGPIPLPRLPEGADNTGFVASHK